MELFCLLPAKQKNMSIVHISTCHKSEQVYGRYSKMKKYAKLFRKWAIKEKMSNAEARLVTWLNSIWEFVRDHSVRIPSTWLTLSDPCSLLLVCARLQPSQCLVHGDVFFASSHQLLEWCWNLPSSVKMWLDSRLVQHVSASKRRFGI